MKLNSIDNLGVDNIVWYGFYFIGYMFVILDIFHTSVKGYLLKILMVFAFHSFILMF